MSAKWRHGVSASHVLEWKCHCQSQFHYFQFRKDSSVTQGLTIHTKVCVCVRGKAFHVHWTNTTLTSAVIKLIWPFKRLPQYRWSNAEKYSCNPINRLVTKYNYTKNKTRKIFAILYDLLYVICQSCTESLRSIQTYQYPIYIIQNLTIYVLYWSV